MAGKMAPLIPTGYETSQAKIAEQRALARALMQQGMQGPGPGARSWTQLLGSLGQAWAGKSMKDEALRDESALNQRRTEEYQTKTRALAEALAGKVPVDQVVQNFGSDPMLQDNPVLAALLAGYQKKQENAATVDAPINMIGPNGQPVAVQYNKAGGANIVPGMTVPTEKQLTPGGEVWDPITATPGTKFNDPTEVGQWGPDGKPTINPALAGFEVAKAGAGAARQNATFINTGESKYAGKIGEDLGGADATTLQAGIRAPELYQNAKEIFNLADKAYTGSAANVRSGFGKLFATAGLGDPSKVANTEVLSSKLAQQTYSAISAMGLGSKNFDTPAEKLYIEKMAAGDVGMTPEGLKLLAKYQMKAARLAQGKAQQTLNRMRQNPATANMVAGYEGQLSTPLGDETGPATTFKPKIRRIR